MMIYKNIILKIIVLIFINLNWCESGTILKETGNIGNDVLDNVNISLIKICFIKLNGTHGKVLE